MAFAINVALCCLSFLILSTPILALKSRPCYRIDGSLNDYSYNGFRKFYPCNPDQEVSHCCFGRDICTDNGLCLGFGPSSPGADRVFMLAGCTDSSWPAPCPQYFVPDRHKILNGSRRLLIWSCAPGESCVGSEDSDFTAACCADPSLRIKTIPLQKSMHLAMDPTQKIEMFADDHDDGIISGSPNDGSTNGGPSNNASDTVLEVLAVLVAVVFGVCQWQFPKTRIRMGWIACRRTNRQQAHARYVEDIIDLAEMPPSFRDGDDTVNFEPQHTIPEFYSDRIGHLLEVEDATPASWRTASWLDV
ncbi:hypothetical protein F4860DRAFT_481459 [Xylaria cubensis]|nr:hypothetical protein F4860DRAFT_481459 [Xylaria cubensis]